MVELALLSDVHMRDGHASRITEELETVLDLLSESDPDHAFVLGDTIEDGESAAVDEANVERVRDLFEGAPFPVTYLPGNHDVEQLSRETLSALLDQEQFHGTVDFGETSVVYLDTTRERTAGPGGELGADQRTWLADSLPEQNAPLILSHHPLGNFDLSDNEWFSEYPERAFPADRKETLDVLESGGPVRGTVSGHIHQNGMTTFRGMAHVSIGAFSKELPDKPVTGTYAEAEIDDRVTIDVKIRDEVIASYRIG